MQGGSFVQYGMLSNGPCVAVKAERAKKVRHKVGETDGPEKAGLTWKLS